MSIHSTVCPWMMRISELYDEDEVETWWRRPCRLLESTFLIQRIFMKWTVWCLGEFSTSSDVEWRCVDQSSSVIPQMAYLFYKDIFLDSIDGILERLPDWTLRWYSPSPAGCPLQAEELAETFVTWTSMWVRHFEGIQSNPMMMGIKTDCRKQALKIQTSCTQLVFLHTEFWCRTPCQYIYAEEVAKLWRWQNVFSICRLTTRWFKACVICVSQHLAISKRRYISNEAFRVTQSRSHDLAKMPNYRQPCPLAWVPSSG